MGSFEQDPPSEENLIDFGFSPDWAENVETESLTQDDEAMIEELSVPVRRPKSQLGEVTRDFRKRLGVMRVEDPDSFTIFKARRLEGLYLHLRPYSLEDVHYQAYSKIKNQSISPYISVRFSEIVSELPANEAQVEILQDRQTVEAVSYLVDLGISHKKLKEMTSQGGEENQYLLRSLHRLLQEPYLREFIAKMPTERHRRGAEDPMGFEEVASRAVKTIRRHYNHHIQLDVGRGGKDARLWHELELRNIERALSFAEPLDGILFLS